MLSNDSWRFQYCTLDNGQNRQKINKERGLGNTVNRFYLTYTHRTLHLTTAWYTYFSRTHGTFFTINYMLCSKTSFNKFERVKIVQSISSNHKGMKLQINSRSKTVKFINMWKLGNTFLNNWKVKEEIRKYLEMNEDKKYNIPKMYKIHQRKC